MVLKPREFFQKKMDMADAGPGQLQVFTDFEHVLSRFRGEDGTSKSMGTAEVLESSPALMPQVCMDGSHAWTS